ncbi:MAG: agglutinin biogenesis protein MshP, partial [Burkholderiales bacterium]
MKPNLRRARGFALVLAVFLLVSLAAIGAYLLSVSNVQVETGIRDEQAARAYQAARAGLEWGAYRVLSASTCDPGPTAVPLAFG